MARKLCSILMCACILSGGCKSVEKKAYQATGWQSLFDGKSLEGWKASENKDTFTVRDGMIVANGPRSHLFYAAPVEDADFKNFEFKADVMTEPEDVNYPNFPGRKVALGTFALQGHDPNSIVYYKNIMVKPLP